MLLETIPASFWRTIVFWDSWGYLVLCSWTGLGASALLGPCSSGFASDSSCRKPRGAKRSPKRHPWACCGAAPRARGMGWKAEAGPRENLALVLISAPFFAVGLYLVFENHPIGLSYLLLSARISALLFFRERIISNFIFLLQNFNQMIVLSVFGNPETWYR